MTRTARRRWSREIESEIDGILLGDTGPALVHGYDPPAGGMWVDDAIPGKLGAYDRGTGDELWISPCEVGYGRGFGAGFGAGGEVVVLGPSPAGYRMVRMAPDNGELLGVRPIEAFDHAVVAEDLSICLSAKRVTAFETSGAAEAWTYSRTAQRYHFIGRDRDRVFVVFSNKKDRRQGVLVLRADSGRLLGHALNPMQATIQDMTVDEKAVVVLTDGIEGALPPEILPEYLARTADEESQGTVSLLALDPTGKAGDSPLWYHTFPSAQVSDLSEVGIAADSGKVYVVRGANLDVCDALTGRALGEWMVPGLDDRIAWTVCQGAGLLAEETRTTVFELPA